MKVICSKSGPSHSTPLRRQDSKEKAIYILLSKISECWKKLNWGRGGNLTGAQYRHVNLKETEFRWQAVEKLMCPFYGWPKILFPGDLSGLLSVHVCRGKVRKKEKPKHSPLNVSNFIFKQSGRVIPLHTLQALAEGPSQEPFSSGGLRKNISYD